MGIRALTVPQWSFGRDRVLLARFSDCLDESNVEVHVLQSNVDHNRTITAFSGEPSQLFEAIHRLIEVCFESIDLNRHVGSHPRIGALDVCPFVLLGRPTESDVVEIHMLVRQFAQNVADAHQIPVYLYERSEERSFESELVQLRKGGFGGMLGKILRPDFGPMAVHPQWGVVTVGVRDFLLTAAVNLKNDDGSEARRIARLIRYLRMDGDPRLSGVRAMAMPLASVNQFQVKVELTMPDCTTLDTVLGLIIKEASENGCILSGCELLGPIRSKDVASATRVLISPQQMIEDCA